MTDSTAKDTAPNDTALAKWSRKFIRERMAEAREASRNGRNVVTYTQGQHEAITTAMAGLLLRNEILAQRVAALEARPELKYLGVWKDGSVYREGAAVTHDGSIRVMEAELMRMVGAVLDCPLPPLLETVDPATLAE